MAIDAGPSGAIRHCSRSRARRTRGVWGSVEGWWCRKGVRGRHNVGLVQRRRRPATFSRPLRLNVDLGHRGDTTVTLSRATRPNVDTRATPRTNSTNRRPRDRAVGHDGPVHRSAAPAWTRRYRQPPASQRCRHPARSPARASAHGCATPTRLLPVAETTRRPATDATRTPTERGLAPRRRRLG
jgi:hypothetical protein